MEAKKCRVDGRTRIRLNDMPTGCAGYDRSKADKDAFIKKTEKNLQQIAELQEKLYAEGREGLLIVLQAMDAAGKDSTIKHVLSSVNPQGVDVCSFKQPTALELAHDFLWRANQVLPTRGKLGVFNRSYYEDVLVVKVHQLQKGYKMAARCIEDKDFFEKRYRHLRHYEEYLYDNSYRVVKIFLHVSKATQKKRFLERLDDPAKNWKFSAADLKERQYWDQYQQAHEEAINATATPQAPWYIVPADQKWYARFLISEIIEKALEDCDPHYPEMPPEEKGRIAECKAALGEAEDPAPVPEASDAPATPLAPPEPETETDAETDEVAAPEDAFGQPLPEGPEPVVETG